MIDKNVQAELINGILSLMCGNVSRIILYGSVARGTDTPESDVDIALIIRERINDDMHSKLIDFTVDLDLKYNKVFSVADIDEAFFLKWKDIIPFYRNVDREGIVLWKAA